MNRAQFDGETYNQERDYSRLEAGVTAVRTFMLRHANKWLTPTEIIEGSNGKDWASTSARVRDLRKPKFGGFNIESRYYRAGVWQYRLVPGEPAQLRIGGELDRLLRGKWDSK